METRSRHPDEVFQDGDLVRLEFLADVREASEDGGNAEGVLQGTQLVGVWEALSPAEEGQCAVHVNGTRLSVDRDDVAVTRLDQECIARIEQERIASEHLAQAKTAERQGKDDEAQQHYARALVELEASGKAPVEIAAERLLYAFLLAKADRTSEAMVQMDRAARACEAVAVHPIYGKNLNEAELAAQALIALGQTALYATDLDEVHRQRTMRQVASRLLAMNKLIKKRYETQVTLLLTAAELLHALGETHEAMTLLEQADTFYQQQLAIMEGWPTIEPITSHLQRVKARLRQVKRECTMKFQVTAATADDLNLLLSALQERLPGLRVTKGVTPERPGKSTRAGVRYTAHLSWTTTTGPDASARHPRPGEASPESRMPCPGRDHHTEDGRDGRSQR
jgi:tetratricopeptide (TPR) repeat protein